jgi:hypothetical protein
MILDLFLLHVFQAPSYCSFTSNLIMFSLIIDYWIYNGIYSAFIMIIINLIIDKSRLCYKITVKYWQNVLYSQLYYNKPQIKTSTKKSAYFTHPDFSAAKIEKKKCPNYASKYGIYHQHIRGLRGRVNELLSQLYPSFSHILCLSEHHMNKLELEQIFLDSYKLEASCCRILYEKRGVSILCKEV